MFSVFNGLYNLHSNKECAFETSESIKNKDQERLKKNLNSILNYYSIELNLNFTPNDIVNITIPFFEFNDINYIKNCDYINAEILKVSEEVDSSEESKIEKIYESTKDLMEHKNGEVYIKDMRLKYITLFNSPDKKDSFYKTIKMLLSLAEFDNKYFTGSKDVTVSSSYQSVFNKKYDIEIEDRDTTKEKINNQEISGNDKTNGEDRDSSPPRGKNSQKKLEGNTNSDGFGLANKFDGSHFNDKHCWESDSSE